MNDYPAEPPRDAITDAHRVYPGDGVAPLKEMLRDLRGLGFRGVSVAGAVQPRLLEAGRPGGGEDRPGEDEGRGAQSLEL